jgi:hypothetical protein
VEGNFLNGEDEPAVNGSRDGSSSEDRNAVLSFSVPLANDRTSIPVPNDLPSTAIPVQAGRSSPTVGPTHASTSAPLPSKTLPNKNTPKTENKDQ